MPCPICDHTMQSLDGDRFGWWWCPRCGSIKSKQPDIPPVAPKLVETVREYLKRAPQLDVERRYLDKTLAEQSKMPADRY